MNTNLTQESVEKLFEKYTDMCKEALNHKMNFIDICNVIVFFLQQNAAASNIPMDTFEKVMQISLRESLKREFKNK